MAKSYSMNALSKAHGISRAVVSKRANREAWPTPRALAAPIEKPAPAGPVQVSAKERREIEADQQAWADEHQDGPPYDRPVFDRPLDRYSHLFELRTFEGVDLIPEDAQFMRNYEAGPEYQAVKGRFDQLAEFKKSTSAFAKTG